MDYAELLDQHEKRVADLVRRKKEIRELLSQLANEEESLDQELLGLTEAANAYRFLTQKAFLAERPEAQSMSAAAAGGNGFTDAMRSVARRIRMPPSRP